jgi:hypothetical protein
MKRFFSFSIAFLALFFISSCKQESVETSTGVCLLKTSVYEDKRLEYEYNSLKKLNKFTFYISGQKSEERTYTYNSSGLEETIFIKHFNMQTNQVDSETRQNLEYTDGKVSKRIHSHGDLITQKDYFKNSAGIFQNVNVTNYIYTYSGTGKILTETNGEYFITNQYNSEDKLAFRIHTLREFNGITQTSTDVKYEVSYAGNNSHSEKFEKQGGQYFLAQITETTSTYTGDLLISKLSNITSYKNGNIFSTTPVNTRQTTLTNTYECD